MAYISSNPNSPLAGLGNVLSNVFNTVFDFLADLTNADARMRAVQALQAMSDEELMTRYHSLTGEVIPDVLEHFDLPDLYQRLQQQKKLQML